MYGTDTGIYMSDRKPKSSGARPIRVLDAAAVTQIDVLEEYQLLLVLASKSLMSYPLEVLEMPDNQSPMLKRPKKIQNHANFFKAGVCMGRHLVCSAKMSGISTTIKVFEPMDTVSKNKKKPAIGRMFQANAETLKPFKVGSATLYCSISLTISRNSMLPQSPRLLISSDLSSALHVPEDSR